MDEKYALLIDAENTTVEYLDYIFKELREYGIITYKRMYGDFTDDRMRKWNEKALEYAIVPIQQPRYNNAKNCADIMLVIDAMDILFENNVDGFCIVSSDSDFTRLVNRLSDAGMKVIGMGKSDASKTLKAACTEYKNIEAIFNEEIAEKEASLTDKEGKIVVTDLEEIIDVIKEIVQNSKNQGKKVGLGGLKSQLQRTYTDFDERNYGYNTMTQFIDDMKEFVLYQEGHSNYVTANIKKIDKFEIEQYIIKLLKKSKLELGTLANLVHNQYPEFNYREYGYSQFSRFVASISNITISNYGTTPQKTVEYIDKSKKI